MFTQSKIKKLYFININVGFWFHFDGSPVDKIVSLITVIIMFD